MPKQGETKQTRTFYGLGIAPGILAILEKLNFAHPTPIQFQAIPVAIQGKDIIGIAQTGTGKTLAFGIPMIQILASSKGGKGLVVLPTRELAIQVDEVLHSVGRSLGLRTAVLIGGLSMGPQTKALRKNPHIIVATPGRLVDHLEQKTTTLSDVKVLVLDEADRMLDMGFQPQIKKILALIPKERQTMLFSATLSSDVLHMANTNMKIPFRIEISPPGSTVDQVIQEIFIVKREAKVRLLEKLLGEYKGSALIFTRTKRGASRLARILRDIGHQAAEIHSNRSLAQRRGALEGFKSGKYRVLVATDIAARGIDVVGIELVLNYDLPEQAGDYVHRIGRTGRAGAQGHAVSFALPDDGRGIRDIEHLIRKNLRVSPLPELPPERSRPIDRERRPDAFFQQRSPRPFGHGQRPSFGRRPRPKPRRRFGG